MATPVPTTRAEVERVDQRMKERSCYRFCGSCGGCSRYSGGLAQCGNCAPAFRRCRCREGVRVSLRDDGLIQITDFGTLGKGVRVDRGIVQRGPAVAEPVRGR